MFQALPRALQQLPWLVETTMVHGNTPSILLPMTVTPPLMSATCFLARNNLLNTKKTLQKNFSFDF